MKSNLSKTENSLRSIAKRCKNISYSTALVLLFAMLGVNAFSEEAVSTAVATRPEITAEATNLERILLEIKAENDKKLEGANLELIQLMEQGDQVVKSPWASWQFGVNYIYEDWGGTYKGRGDKSEKYPFEGKFTRGQWWQSSVSPESKTYGRVASTNDPYSALTNTRNDLGLTYGLVGSRKIPDEGVVLIIEPKIDIKIPTIPTLSIAPNVVTPNVRFTIPDVTTTTFSPATLPNIEPNVFNPPALSQVATGFAQDMSEVNFYLEPNVILNNVSGQAAASGSEISITDSGFTTDGFSFSGKRMAIESSGTITGTWNWQESNPDHNNMKAGSTYTSNRIYNSAAGASYRAITSPLSPQTVFSFTQYQRTTAIKPGDTYAKSEVSGNWTLRNMTENPLQRNQNPSNTVRFISVNGTHVAAFYDPMYVNFNGNLNLYGRSTFDTLTGRRFPGWTHMTVAVEQQAASAKESIFTNNGTINLKKDAAKPAVSSTDDALGSYLIGFSAMIEDYAQYQPIASQGNQVNQRLYSNITFRPWASEMNNKGTINVESVESIGIDFAEFSFEPNAGSVGQDINPLKSVAWGNKGSLRIYMNTGDINVSSVDPQNTSSVRGSYGIRVPNIFSGSTAGKTVDTGGIYFDETIIDGNGGTVTLTGSHNVGVSISKKIGGSGTGANANTDTYTETTQTVTSGAYAGNYQVGTGTMSVYNYQTGRGANGTGLGGAGTSLNGVYTTDIKTLDNTGRDENDLIGNIYNLNIVVDGTENVGFLRNYDYMYGTYSAAVSALAQNDFNIKDTHINSINFTSSTDGGTLFRTDRYGINLEKNLTGVEAVNPGNASVADKRYNIVMLANGLRNPTDTVVPKVKNTGNITISSGGQNVIGLMAYNGGRAEVVGDLTITNSPTSIGLVINGSNANRVSSGTSSGNITVTGTNTAGVYNNGGVYTLTGGTINANGAGTIGVYASANGTTLADTTLGTGTVSATGTGAVALYAGGGSDIKLNGTTLTIGNGGLLFYGAGTNTDLSQLYLTGNATANIATGGTAFYVKNVSGSPLSNIRHNSSTGTLTVNLANGSTLIVAEGNGGNVGGELVSNLSSGVGSVTGINIVGTAGQYVPYKASRVHLTVDTNSNLNNSADAYLNSEFSSSSITLNNGVTISGSGALTTPLALANKAKAAIAQKNTTVGVNRNDVILTNNGTINLTGTGMAGIVGEFAQIDNNNIINTTGNNSTAIIVSNGGIATNNGAITVGNGGVGIAGINYLGVTDTPSTTQPTTGNGFIEIVHNGSIVSNGTTSSSIGVLGLDLETNNVGATVNATQASSVTLGNGSKIDVSSSSNGVGVYSKGVYRGGVARISDNGSNITIGENGVGIYSEGAVINAIGGNITAKNNTTAKGILTDSDVVSSKEITLLGDKSIGIHNYGVNTMYPTSVGRNYINISNAGKITLGNSANINDPSIGIYTQSGNIAHTGTITGGTKVIGILSETPYTVGINGSGSISLGDGAIGVYKQQGAVNLASNSSIKVGNNSAIGVVANNNATVNNNSANVTIGNESFGFAILGTGTNNYTSSAGSNVNMGSGSVYLYKAGTGTATTRTNVNSLGSRNAALYATGGAVINNYGNINYTTGVGNVGGYAATGSTVNNYGNITVAGSDIDNDLYSIGLATIGGTVKNNSGGVINVAGDYGIGMFAQGTGSYAENNGTINVSGNTKNAYGMYLDDNAKGVNNGTIKTTGGTSGAKAIGVAVLNGAEFTNNGTVDIDLNNSTGVYVKDAVIKNYGTINISGTGSMGVRSSSGKYEDASGNQVAISSANLSGVTTSNGAVDLVVDSAFDPSATKGSTSILPDGTTGTVRAYINGEEVNVHDFSPGPNPYTQNYAFSNVGIYIDTLGRTKPINWVDGYNPMVDNDLIIGAEVTELSNEKAIRVGSNIITPFLNSGQTFSNLNVISGSLTWVATPTLDPTTGYPNAVTLAKVPYTDFVSKSENAWNFADGLEQRYGVEGLGSREKQLFNKLNNIGQNEQVLLTQAYDEMMGHQYANVQQRIQATGSILDKEFDYLKAEWRTASKDSNKIKVFGTRGEYNTDTAGIIDYKNHAYGVAYVGENETVRLGNSTGWYTGIVHNTFKFKDIGNSKEEQLQAKFGLYNTKAFDDNGSLAWTISGEAFVGYNKMHRKFLVVDEIFNAKSKYWSYGAALKNELSKTIRLSEDFSLKGYGALKLEYGRFEKIREKDGEIRLEIKSNDYISVKPEIGGEVLYKTPVATRSFLKASLGVAYENELGRVADGKNKGRVAYTNADWFGIRGEKDDRRGNIKTDLNIGFDNEAYGITANIGYDTKGENVRGGLGLRVIF